MSIFPDGEKKMEVEARERRAHVGAESQLDELVPLELGTKRGEVAQVKACRIEWRGEPAVWFQLGGPVEKSCGTRS